MPIDVALLSQNIRWHARELSRLLMGRQDYTGHTPKYGALLKGALADFIEIECPSSAVRLRNVFPNHEASSATS